MDHAVNAMVARDFDRARAAAKAADAAVARGDDAAAAARPADRHQGPGGRPQGLRTTFGSPIFRDHVPAADERLVAAVRQAGAIVIGKTNTPEFGAGANTRNAVYGATGNPFDPAKSCAGSSGGSAVALATGMVPICSGSDTGGSLRNPAAFCGIVGFRPTPGLVPTNGAALGWSDLPVPGRWRAPCRTCACCSPRWSATTRAIRWRPPCTASTVRRAEDFCRPARIDLSRLRVALTPDFGFAPTERHIAEVFAEKTGLFRHVFARAEDATPDCTGTDEAFEVLRALASWPAIRRRCAPARRMSARMCAPMSRKGCATAPRMSRGRWRCRPRCIGAGRRSSSDWDVILTPSITISPRSWRELYPAEIDGKPTRTYFHWLALAYAVTLVGPSGGFAAGRARSARHAVRPADRRAARRRCVRAVGGGGAGALLAGDPRTARPVPDLAR